MSGPPVAAPASVPGPMSQASISPFGRVFRSVASALALLASHTASAAQFVAPYVDTVEEDVELILDLADVGPGDYLIDLGSGDGRFVIAAARRGALAHGVELDPDLVERSRRNAREAGVADRTAFVRGDIFEADIDRATVVTIYLFPEANLALRPKLLAELAPGTRLVSNSFDMGDWEPDARAQGRTSGGALLWIIPADVGGAWSLSVDGHEARLGLAQRYQRLEATLTIDGESARVDAATLRGDRLTLVAATPEATMALQARVRGERMEGTAQVGERVVPFAGRRVVGVPGP
jgi:SAM-dependent methyltransferase